MNTIIVDDNKYSLADAKACFEKIQNLHIVGSFTSSVASLDFIYNNSVDLAVLDVEMPAMSGIELAGKIHEYNKQIQIIFLTGFNKFAFEAYKLNVVSYLMKPCDLGEATEAIEKAQKLFSSKPIQAPIVELKTENASEHATTHLSEPLTKPFIKTFGRFDILINKVPIHFTYAKSKELLAILVDAQGGTVSMEQIISLLWEDRPFDEKAKQLYRKTVSILRKVLQDYEIEDICFYYRAGLAIDISKIECDLYRLLDGNPMEKKNYNGLYLSDYSWGEATNAKLDNLV